MIDRRRFTALLAGTAGGLAVGCGGETRGPGSAPAAPEGEPPPEAVARLAGRLTEYFHYLRLAPGTAEEFSRELIRRIGMPAVEAGAAQLEAAMESYLEEAAERFLLSTDFFENGGDESRLVTYRTYYDPYVSLCGNPLAVLD